MLCSRRFSLPAFFFALVLTALSAGSAPALRAQEGVGARAYLVADAASGRILAEKDANAKLQVASLTKIATAAVVLDWAEAGKRGLDTLITIPAAATAVGGQNPVGFQAGDQVSLRDLLYAALLQSDNIAAETLAYHVGSQIQSGESGAKATPVVRFVAQMNALARTLGMERTRFLNPTGFDAEEKPFSTAADMARLMRYALGKASFKFFVAQKERKIAIVRAGSSLSQQPPVASAVPPPTALGPAPAAAAGANSPAPSPTPPNSVAYLLRNTNELLGVKNVDGGKTGQTSKAGSCLIVTAAREPLVKQISDTSSEITQRRLIVVVLGAPDRFRETSALIDRGTALFDSWQAAGRPSGGPKESL